MIPAGTHSHRQRQFAVAPRAPHSQRVISTEKLIPIT
jgi:hypothetical protein